MKNLWAVEWLRWPGYGQFWGQLVREHMRSKKRQVLDMRAELDPATGRVKASIDAIDADDRFEDQLDAKMTVLGPLGTNGEKDKTPPLNPPMHQTAPGRYESDFALPRFGSYLLHGTLEKTTHDPAHPELPGKSVSVAESFGHVANPYPREYLALEPDVRTLERVAAETGWRLPAGSGEGVRSPRARRSASTRICGHASWRQRSPSSSSICWCAACASSIAR